MVKRVVLEPAPVFGTGVQAQVVCGDGWRGAYGYSDFSARVLRATIQRMRAVMQDHQGVHFKAQCYLRTRLSSLLLQSQIAFGVGDNLTEPVDVGRHVRFTEAVFGQFDQE